MTPNGGKKDPQDQILESCLEEILGGHTPPDLKAEILARHAADSEQPAAPPVHVSAPPVSSAAQRLGNRNQTETGTPARRRWVIASLVTSTAVAALIMISFQLSWQDEGNPPALAQGQNNAPSSSNEVDSTPALPQQPAAPKANNPSTDTDSAVADFKKAVLGSGLSVSELVKAAWASASTYRNSDHRGGANGAHIRFDALRNWAVNDPDELGKVLAKLDDLSDPPAVPHPRPARPTRSRRDGPGRCPGARCR